MARVSWDKLLPLLAPHIPGVPEVSMRQALAASAAEFLGRTHLWREQLDPQTVTPGEATYTLFADAVVESILWARLDGSDLYPTDVRVVPALPVAPGRPTHYWRASDTAITLYPTPNAPGELDALVALKPTRSASGIEDWIYETWADTIVDGAIWNLANIPHKSWSNLERAQYHKARFDRAAVNARVRDVRQVPQRIHFRFR